MNANHSPWMAGTIHRENQAGLDLLLQCDGVHSDRWVELLEDIAWDRRVDSVELTGNLDASEFLAWDTFKAKGEYVQMRRWFSWFKRFRTTETPGGNFLFFFLLHLAPQGRFGLKIKMTINSLSAGSHLSSPPSLSQVKAERTKTLAWPREADLRNPGALPCRSRSSWSQYWAVHRL